jgi:predicted transcriptional regulator
MSYDEKIVKALEELGIATTTEITEYIGGNETSVNRALHSMVKFRMVVMLGQVITTCAPTKRWRLTA